MIDSFPNVFIKEGELPEKVVEDVKKGMIEYRADSYGNVHSVIGKVSFDAKALKENFNYLYNTIISFFEY